MESVDHPSSCRTKVCQPLRVIEFSPNKILLGTRVFHLRPPLSGCVLRDILWLPNHPFFALVEFSFPSLVVSVSLSHIGFFLSFFLFTEVVHSYRPHGFAYVGALALSSSLKACTIYSKYNISKACRRDVTLTM